MTQLESQRSILIATVLALAPTFTQAAEQEKPTESATSSDDRGELSFHGITLYGTIDIALAYQSHGAKLSEDFPPGLEYVVSKNSGRSLVSLAPNALSASKLGLQGDELVTDDLSGVFQVETQFIPTSGHLADGLKTIVRNNGLPPTRQTAFGDSNKAGEIFAGQAWAGLRSKRFGTLTFGRQYSLFLDDVLAYDPVSASHAFSVAGYQGAAQAGGSTEDARLDRSLKYLLNLEPFRIASLYAFGVGDRPTSHVYQFDAGYDLERATFDLTYGRIKDSVSADPLSAAQLLTAPRNSVAATVSDNNALGAFAKYSASSQLQAFLGYEHIEFQNPSHPLAVGDRTIGGYVLGAVDNAAYAHHRHLDYFWTGARYTIDPKIALTLAYYRSTQNSYGPSRCANDALPTCSGTLNAISASAVFTLDRWWDLYAGAMYSRASNGLASGFLNRSSVDPMAGVRFSF